MNAVVVAVLGALSAGGCKPKTDVTVVFEEVSPADAGPVAVEVVEGSERPDVPAPEPDAPAPAPMQPVTEAEKQEKWDGFIAEGRKFVKSMTTERFEILQQMRGIKLEKETEAYKKVVSDIADKLQDFELGDTAEQLETAPDRLCALITEARAQADELSVALMADREKNAADLKALDDKKAAGGTVTQKQFDKVTELQERLSAPPLAARHVLLAVKSLLDEALVIVDYGVHRARRRLVECLTKIGEKPLELDLAQKNLEHVIERARKLLSIPLQ